MIEKLSILHVLDKYGIEYFQVGTNIFRSYCPFHFDNSKPNFTIYISTNSFYCFACGVGGSVLDLVAKLESVSKEDALKLIINDITWEEIEANLKMKPKEFNFFNEAFLETISKKMKRNEITLNSFKKMVDIIWRKSLTLKDVKNLINGEIQNEEKKI
ncbi:MAG: CHC2 zinc finger domain-containing protein [Nanopusillaceae archaeon]